MSGLWPEHWPMSLPEPGEVAVPPQHCMAVMHAVNGRIFDLSGHHDERPR